MRRPNFQLPQPMARLHERLEHYDEFERPVRGFFITELDRNSKGQPEGDPVLIYVTPASLGGEARRAPGPRPPDWIGEVVFAADAACRRERFAEKGVSEYWLVRIDESLPGGISLVVHREPDPEAKVFGEVREVAPEQELMSPTFPGLKLKPAELLG